MSIIGKKILEIQNKPSKNKRRELKIKSFEEAESIAILYTWSDSTKMEAVDLFAKSIEQEVDVLCYNPTKDIIECNHKSLHISDLNSLGKINSQDTKSFLSKHFDYLLVLDFELSEVTKHLILKCVASYKIGFYSAEHENYFDLMININKQAGIVNFAEQILKYIKAIRHE